MLAGDEVMSRPETGLEYSGDSGFVSLEELAQDDFRLSLRSGCWISALFFVGFELVVRHCNVGYSLYRQSSYISLVHIVSPWGSLSVVCVPYDTVPSYRRIKCHVGILTD